MASCRDEWTAQSRLFLLRRGEAAAGEASAVAWASGAGGCPVAGCSRGGPVARVGEPEAQRFVVHLNACALAKLFGDRPPAPGLAERRAVDPAPVGDEGGQRLAEAALDQSVAVRTVCHE